MRLALRTNPCAFQHTIHLGYVVDYDIVVKEACRYCRNSRDIVDAGLVHPFHPHQAFLDAAGFSAAGNVKTLKQLSRQAIHSGLKFRQIFLPIPELNLPLPNSLVNYLCFDDVNF